MEKARQKPKNSGMEINLPKLPIGKDQTENFRLIFLVWKLPYRKVQTPNFGLEGKEYWPCVVFNNRDYVLWRQMSSFMSSFFDFEKGFC